MSKSSRITISLCDKDLRNINNLRMNLQTKNNAQAICLAISLANSIVKRIHSGDGVFLQKKDGSFERIMMPCLDL